MEEPIILIILDTGEYMLGTGQVESNGDISMNKPVAVQVRQDGQGLMFMPYLQLTDSVSCVFKEKHVRHVFDDPKEALQENYKKQFGESAGIVVPDKTILT